MDELVAFVRAALDEDERKIAAMEREETRVRTAPIFQGHPVGWLAGVDIFVSSKRWRAEVEAKRERLDWIEGELRDDPADETAHWLARIEAQPYAGLPGWREEWRLTSRS